MGSVLKLQNISKVYGDKVVVNNASFEIEKGSVCGLLGPNGAGKTTIMKMIMNEIKCDRGYIAYSDNLKIKFLSDVPNFYEFYTVEEYLRFILEITHFEEDKNVRIDEVLSLLNLKEYSDLQIKKLSRGLRQKVGIASVIVEKPDVLILDEPVSALDPIGRSEMFDIILKLKGETTIVFSSHILTDVERVCDHIILINRGKILLNDKISNISLDRNLLLVNFKTREDLISFKESFSLDCKFNAYIENCLEVESDDMIAVQKKVFSLLSKKGILVKSVSIVRDSLEDIFLREVKNNG